MQVPPSQRQVLAITAGLAGWSMLPSAMAATDEVAAAVSSHAAGATVTAGKVKLDIAELVDNDNVVPITVTVDVIVTLAACIEEPS